jgi:hypothetical protein
MAFFQHENAVASLVTDLQFDLLQLCPEVVLGKYIAITSFDSGPLAPTDEETGGWLGDSWENCVQPQSSTHQRCTA